jgi:formate dehydrogenase alpha subunit
VAGLAATFGSGAMTNNIDDFGNARCFFAIGTNTTEAHPVLAMKVRQTIRKNGAKLIVANPMRIGLVPDADLWLQHRSGTDVALMMGMMKVIVDEGLHDKEFIEQRCENFEEFRESLQNYPLDRVAEITGVPAEKIAEAARMYAINSPSTIMYAMGITQHSHGTDNVIATANMSMLTGNVGKPGTGVNPLRGQNNVQGACDMGGLPDVYPGYQRVSDENAQKKFEEAWGARMNPQPGLKLTEMIPAALTGNVKAIYLVGENPVLTDADGKHVREAFENLDFFVVQDIFMTETAELADVVLPATCFAEEDGTYTNTERRVQRLRKAVEPPGIAMPNWWIIAQVARKMGVKGFEYESAAEIAEEIASVTPSYGGISYKRLEEGSLQWPCSSDDHPGTCILHEETFARGKGHFVPLEFMPPPEMPDEQYPFMLTTGRRLFHFHSTVTRKVRGLNALMKEELAHINPKDAARLEIADGDRIKVASRQGEVTVNAMVTDDVPEGVVAMSFHFAESPTNILTSSSPTTLDPVSKTPAYKTCPVRIEKLTGVAVG